MEPTDVLLVERLMARDEAALEEVVRRCGAAVYGMARRVLADATFAEEVAQDTFLALWRRPGSYDPDRGTLRAFLVGTARNKAIDLVRREEAARRAGNTLLAEAEATSARLSGAEHLEEIEERQRMAQALAQLSRVQREALVLAYYGGRTYREVAQELGIPEGTAKTRLRDGLKRLREVIGSPGPRSEG
ncbi:MAG: RNA polymerase sigma factor [Actinomycetota bacterium]